MTSLVSKQAQIMKRLHVYVNHETGVCGVCCEYSQLAEAIGAHRNTISNNASSKPWTKNGFTVYFDVKTELKSRRGDQKGLNFTSLMSKGAQ